MDRDLEFIRLSRRAASRGALLFFQLGLAVGVFIMLLLFGSH